MTITTRLRRTTTTAAILYAVALLLIAFWPTPVDRPASGFLSRLLSWLADRGLGFITYDVIESFANVLLFIPAGLLLVVLLGVQWWWLSILGGIAASVAIEMGQHLFLAGRFATIDDVYANTIGAVVGTVIGVVALLLAGRADVTRHRRAQAQHRVRARRVPTQTP
ncbi:glycopeptide antibiotics resistance protein [Mycetocola sp. CAN_C7]|uniref:VanZ family protein n=1 Tax=Mycetocola sp. CAN_C7 TaxID=2787724 RepID=UPI0018CBAB88